MKKKNKQQDQIKPSAPVRGIPQSGRNKKRPAARLQKHRFLYQVSPYETHEKEKPS